MSTAQWVATLVISVPVIAIFTVALVRDARRSKPASTVTISWTGKVTVRRSA